MLCLNCQIREVSSVRKNSKFCSRKCAAEYRVKNPEYIKKLSKQLTKYCERNPRKLSAETKTKISKAITGKSNVWSDAAKLRAKGRIAWNKGLKLGPLYEETKRKISLNNKGGRCSWYEITKVDGSIVKVQGSYEFRFAKILNVLDPDWCKPSIWNRSHQFQWRDSTGNYHWYTPDFWSPKFQKYFEIKGFWTKITDRKRTFVESLKNVEIVYLKDLERYEKQILGI